MQARIVAIKDLTLAGAHIAEGQVMAAMEFQDPRLAEFFAARLGWSFFRVELDTPTVDVGAESLDHLPIVFEMLGQRDEHGNLIDEAPAAALLKALAEIGVTSIATLAKADAKALRAIPAIGSKAGSLTRAAKQQMAVLRHRALAPADVIEVVGEPPVVVATIVADDPKPKKGKKPKS